MEAEFQEQTSQEWDKAKISCNIFWPSLESHIVLLGPYFIGRSSYWPLARFMGKDYLLSHLLVGRMSVTLWKEHVYIGTTIYMESFTCYREPSGHNILHPSFERYTFIPCQQMPHYSIRARLKVQKESHYLDQVQMWMGFFRCRSTSTDPLVLFFSVCRSVN